jgi:hypothetical protein
MATLIKSPAPLNHACSIVVASFASVFKLRFDLTITLQQALHLIIHGAPISRRGSQTHHSQAEPKKNAEIPFHCKIDIVFLIEIPVYFCLPSAFGSR